MMRVLFTGSLIALLFAAPACVHVSASTATEGGADVHVNGLERLRATCDDGEVPHERAGACLTLAGFFQHGAFGLPRDTGQAVALWQQAVDILSASCERGDARDCTRAASALGMGLRPGEDEDAATREAVAWIQRYADDGCRGGDAVGCALLGLIYEQGRGVPRDLARAVAQYDRACAAGHARSCLTLAAMHEGEGAASAAAYRRACDAGSGFACAATAQHYRKGVGVRVDADQAGHLFARGCALGDPAACVLGTEMFARAADRRRAAVLASAGCTQGFAQACLLLGELYEQVEGGKRGAYEAYRKGCEVGEERACAAVRRVKRTLPLEIIPGGDDGG